jgi:hypothetical protein
VEIVVDVLEDGNVVDIIRADVNERMEPVDDTWNVDDEDDAGDMALVVQRNHTHHHRTMEVVHQKEHIVHRIALGHRTIFDDDLQEVDTLRHPNLFDYFHLY